MSGARNDDDEELAFEEAMRGVRRLRGARAAAGDFHAEPAVPRAQPRPAGPPFEVTVNEEAITGRARDVNREMVRRLRRGDPPVAARLDLHGRVLAEVEGALGRFIAAARRHGQRVGLVIHGRGNRSDGGGSVLRPAVWAWLGSGAAARAGVRAFVTAGPRDGGAGATVILLRR
jgi:DNA-nicking Smr family endonuclease